MDSNSLSHTRWNCKYHIVFAPKYRRKVAYGKIKQDIANILSMLCKRKSVKIIEAEICPDHVHMLVEIPPSMSVSYFVGYLKGKSTLMIFERHANLKYKYGNRHFWCRGYYVDTVGKNAKKIEEYIANQLQEDLEYDQMTLKEYIDPFTGNVVNLRKLKKHLTSSSKNVAPQLIIKRIAGYIFMKNILKKIIVETKNLIQSESFHQRHRLAKGFSRQRKFSFTHVIYFILARENKSININLANLRKIFPHLKIPYISKQAVSKARQKVSSNACLELCQTFSGLYYSEKKTFSLWHGFHIYAVDGSTIQIPISKENIRFWGSNPNQYGIEEPLASTSLLYDVLEGIIVDAYIGEYRLNERTAACKHIDFFTRLNVAGSHIFLFDRGYPSYDLFQKLICCNLFFVMRLSKSFKKLIHTDNSDTSISYWPKGKKTPLSLRIIHLTLPDGTTEYLVTNITDLTFTLDTFKELYFLRWGIESRYKELKISYKLESFSGYKPEIIKQDFYAAVFLSNLSAVIKNAADPKIKNHRKNKHRYQANKNFIINQTKTNILTLLTIHTKKIITLIDDIVEEAIRNRSEIRPGRQFPRHKKYTRRKYCMNDKPCI